MEQKELHTGQIDFAINSFISYLDSINGNVNVSSKSVETARNQSVAIIADKKKQQMSLQDIVKQFNKVVELFNKSINLTSHQPPYPLFDTNLQVQVRTQVFAYQSYLVETMSGGNLPLQEELPAFRSTSALWQRICSNSITPRSGIDNLTQIIQKVNAKLDKKHHYPIPNANHY